MTLLPVMVSGGEWQREVELHGKHSSPAVKLLYDIRRPSLRCVFIPHTEPRGEPKSAPHYAPGTASPALDAEEQP